MADMKWIPVTERLPERSGEYLVSQENTVYLAQWFDGKHYVFDPSLEIDDKKPRSAYEDVVKTGYKGWCELVDDMENGYYAVEELYCSDTIVAWMPLPEPYDHNN